MDLLNRVAEADLYLRACVWEKKREVQVNELHFSANGVMRSELRL